MPVDKLVTLTYAAIMKVMAIALVLLFCAAGEQAGAAEPGLLRAGVQAQADFEWTADGLRGLCPDILSALQKRDPALKFHWAPPALPERRLLSELTVGDLDVACGFARSPERERQFQVPDVVLYEKNHLVAVVRDGDPPRFEFAGRSQDPIGQGRGTGQYRQSDFRAAASVWRRQGLTMVDKLPLPIYRS